MRFGSFGLRGKFVAALVVASVLPLVIGVVMLQTIGFEHLLAERGKLLEAEARGLAGSLDRSVRSESEKLAAWIAADPEVVRGVAAASREGASMDAESRELATAALEAAWAGLQPGDSELAQRIGHPSAGNLREFMAMSSGVAEVILSDRFGRLVAATEKTSDFDQSDEWWWREGHAGFYINFRSRTSRKPVCKSYGFVSRQKSFCASNYTRTPLSSRESGNRVAIG